MTPSRATRFLLAAAVASSAVFSAARAETGFAETFADDPVAAGRFRVHDGDVSRFVYQPESQTLLARYNTLQPTARLIRPFCPVLTEADSFEFRVVFRIRSAGFVADPRRTAQIAFGLMNTVTTGADRVYGLNGQGAFDLVSFDYFPNVTYFGGPSAGPTLINRDTGGLFSSAINFEFGPETEIKASDGEGPLPLDAWLTAEIRYDGPPRQAKLRVLSDDTPLPINLKGKGGKVGGSDSDITTIITNLTGAGFTVDSFGLFLWVDTSATFATVVADVDFRSITMSSLVSDFDHDGDVSPMDLAHFEACATGPALPQLNPDCQDADLDCDGDVDQADFGLLQAQIARSQ